MSSLPFAVPDRVVPLCLRRPDDEAEGQMVLPEVLAGSQEEVDTQQLDISDTNKGGRHLVLRVVFNCNYLYTMDSVQVHVVMGSHIHIHISLI